MPVQFSPKEAIAKVASVAVTAWAASGQVDPETAKLFGGMAEGIVKGFKYAKKGETPKEQLLKAVREATGNALKTAGCEFVPGCRDAIARDIFSCENAALYLQTEDKEKLLHDTVKKIISRFPDCDPDTFPIKDIANSIVESVSGEIQKNTDMLALATHVTTESNHQLLLQICAWASKQKTASLPESKWLTMPCSTASPHYVDRPEFDELMTVLKQHRKVLLCGMGGIGKTELMRKACDALKDEYQLVAWVQYTGSLASSLTAQIAVEEFKTLPEAEKLEAIKHMLIRAGEGLLLFVDNVSSNAQEDKGLDLLQKLEGTVLITSRPPRLLTGFYDVSVDILEVEECKKLFYAYAGTQPLVDETGLEEIIGLAGQHTLVLEILARSAKVRNMTVPYLLEKLHQKGFDIHIPVATAHSGEAPEILPEQLEKLYDIADTQSNPLYMRILKSFSILPYLPLSAQDVINFLELDETQEQGLYDLLDLGWLEQSDTCFAMHPVIRQVMQKEKLTLDDCRGFIENLLIAANDFFSKIKYRPYIAQVAECFCDVDALVAGLYSKLSMIHMNHGQLVEARLWQFKAKEIWETLYPEGTNPDLATSYGNLSMICEASGELPEALVWQKKAMEIRETLHFESQLPFLATDYSNISIIYEAMGNLQEALVWQMKAI